MYYQNMGNWNPPTGLYRACPGAVEGEGAWRWASGAPRLPGTPHPRAVPHVFTSLSFYISIYFNKAFSSKKKKKKLENNGSRRFFSLYGL